MKQLMVKIKKWFYAKVYYIKYRLICRIPRMYVNDESLSYDSSEPEISPQHSRFPKGCGNPLAKPFKTNGQYITQITQ